MAQAGKIRVIKRGMRQAAGVEAKAAAPEVAPEREVKNVVSEWVRDHQRRTEEFRRNFTHLLRDMGFVPPHLTTGR